MFRMIFIIPALMLSESVLAVSISETPANKPYFISISAGPTWVTGNRAQTLTLQQDVVKTYTGKNEGNAFPSAEIFVGLQRAWLISKVRQPLQAQIGISVVGAGDAKFYGNIWDDADPAFNNSSYTYQVNHVHVAIKARLIADGSYGFKPYLSVATGVGFNHAFDYSSQPTITEAVTIPPFRSNTTTSFTYTLGVGLQKSFTSQLEAAIGYEFADWGKTELARATGQTMNQGLTLNHLYANQLQFSLIYSA